MATSLRLFALNSPLQIRVWQGRLHLYRQTLLQAVRLQIYPDGQWRLRQSADIDPAGQRIQVLESLVWTWLAGVRVQTPEGMRLWLLSWRRGRSDHLLRQWLQTLPSATGVAA